MGEGKFELGMILLETLGIANQVKLQSSCGTQLSINVILYVYMYVCSKVYLFHIDLISDYVCL